MYINYVSHWIVETLQIRVPLVISQDTTYLITIWDLFMLTVFLAIFVVLIKYIITDNVDLKVGDTDVNYSSSSYLNKRINKDVSKFKKYRSSKKESGNK